MGLRSPTSRAFGISRHLRSADRPWAGPWGRAAATDALRAGASPKVNPGTGKNVSMSQTFGEPLAKRRRDECIARRDPRKHDWGWRQHGCTKAFFDKARGSSGSATALRQGRDRARVTRVQSQPSPRPKGLSRRSPRRGRRRRRARARCLHSCRYGTAWAP
jgi:hypothetical protein